MGVCWGGFVKCATRRLPLLIPDSVRSYCRLPNSTKGTDMFCFCCAKLNPNQPPLESSHEPSEKMNARYKLCALAGKNPSRVSRPSTSLPSLLLPWSSCQLVPSLHEGKRPPCCSTQAFSPMPRTQMLVEPSLCAVYQSELSSQL